MHTIRTEDISFLYKTVEERSVALRFQSILEEEIVRIEEYCMECGLELMGTVILYHHNELSSMLSGEKYNFRFFLFTHIKNVYLMSDHFWPNVKYVKFSELNWSYIEQFAKGVRQIQSDLTLKSALKMVLKKEIVHGDITCC